MTTMEDLNRRERELVSALARQAAHGNTVVVGELGREVLSVRAAREVLQVAGSAFWPTEADLLADFASAENGDRAARERIALAEYRTATSSSNFVGLVPPTHLIEPPTGGPVPAPLLSAIAEDLADKGMTVRTTKWGTRPSSTAQTAEGATITGSDPTLTTVSFAVDTYPAMVDLTFQSLERSSVADTVLLPTLASTVDASIEADFLNGSGASGKLAGLIGATGSTITYTDGTPTVAELVPKLEQAHRAVLNSFAPAASPITLVMHPRRRSWFRENTAVEKLGIDPLAGFRVITSKGIPTNLGAGTNEDVLVVFAPGTVRLWWSPLLVQLGREASAASMTARLVVHRYCAGGVVDATGVAIVTGTGLVAPA